MSSPLIYPMAAHVGLAALLYASLTVARAPSVWGVGRRADGSNPWTDIEPRISANLSNQFEWPVFFHVACLLQLAQHAGGHVQLWLAWIFIAGRLAHTGVQVFTTNHSTSRRRVHGQLRRRPGHVALAAACAMGACRADPVGITGSPVPN